MSRPTDRWVRAFAAIVTQPEPDDRADGDGERGFVAASDETTYLPEEMQFTLRGDNVPSDGARRLS